MYWAMNAKAPSYKSMKQISQLNHLFYGGGGGNRTRVQSNFVFKSFTSLSDLFPNQQGSHKNPASYAASEAHLNMSGRIFTCNLSSIPF